LSGYSVVAEGLRKRFPVGGLLGGRRFVEALRGVSFRARRGEVLGLLGPNGAGKTTTVKILSTLLEPDEGDAWVAGFHVVRERRLVRRRIGVMLSVERGFYWKLTGRENLFYFGMIYGIPRSELKRRIEELSDMLGLEEVGALDKPFEEMSLGMKARLGLARALLAEPEVVILDEPTLGLDPASARRVRRVIRRLAGEGRTVLVTTHNMVEAEEICDRIAFIVKGRIVAEGSVDELKRRLAPTVSVVARLRPPPYGGEELLARALEGFKFSVDERGEHVVVRVPVRRGEEHVVVERLLALVREGFKLVETRVEEPGLEDLYIELTRGGGRG